MLSNRKLYYKDSKNSLTIKTYTSLDDIYSGKGLPMTYKGETFYAPLVDPSDVYSSPIKVLKDGETLAVAYDTVSKTQSYYSNNVLRIELSGNKTSTRVYGSFAVIAPISGYYKVVSSVRGGQTGWGYSSDSWQYSQWMLYLDGKLFANRVYRRSQGTESWKTLYNGNLYLSSGSHIIQLNILGKCSSKDDHLTVCYEWDNNITIQEV